MKVKQHVVDGVEKEEEEEDGKCSSSSNSHNSSLKWTSALPDGIDVTVGVTPAQVAPVYHTPTSIPNDVDNRP